MAPNAVWTVERTRAARLPYRISIERDGASLLTVRAASLWPGPGQQIFCVRERELDPSEYLEPVERESVVSVARIGRKLAVVIDRGSRKRCEFLTVEKTRRDRSGAYEQIFFRTEAGIRAHRSRTRLELRPPDAVLTVAVDSAERYPWTFPGAVVHRRKLPVGDYALIADERVMAVVERKTFDNLLGDLGAIQALHHQLADLSTRERPALVIEAQYGDFLDERRLAGRWPAGFVARALSEMAALHPALPIVFAGNRKLANLWTRSFFDAVRSAGPSRQLDLLAESGGEPRIEERIRTAAVGETGPFSTKGLAGRFAGVTVARVRKVLAQLVREGLLARTGAARGMGARWVAVGR